MLSALRGVLLKVGGANVTNNIIIQENKIIQSLKNIQNRANLHGWPQPYLKPEIGKGIAFRRIVHYEDEEEYTVKPLRVTNLAGRDPETGKKIVNGIGGGIKRKFHWIKWIRDGPYEGPPKEEEVIQIMKDWCRTAHIALVASGDEIKYIIATENMKAGDIIKTSRFIPRIPVLGNEGDGYPLGALPVGTIICCIEKTPGDGCVYIQAAGTCGKILSKADDKVIVQMPSKHKFSFDQNCLAVIGRVSNVEFNKIHIGSPNWNRWLGNRPRSGLWQRKTGKHGRKIYPPKPIKTIGPSEVKQQKVMLTLKSL